jgi:hypothetical protein
MGVRKTESRIPANMQVSDLGQAVMAGDNRCALVSYISSPVVVNRDNVYVVFVTDAGLAASTQSFAWGVSEGGGATMILTTDHGEFTYRPLTAGILSVTVRLLGAGNAEQANLQMSQEIVAPNAELEGLITTAANDAGPTVPSPDVARELINDHNPYYQSVTLQTPESGDGFKSLVFSMVFDGALVSVRPTPFLPASLVWWPVYCGPQTFSEVGHGQVRAMVATSSCGSAAVREDGAGALSGGGCSRVIVLSVAEAVFELNASTKA